MKWPWQPVDSITFYSYRSIIFNLHSYEWRCKVLCIFMHLLSFMYTIYRTTEVAYTFCWQSMVNLSYR